MSLRSISKLSDPLVHLSFQGVGGGCYLQGGHLFKVGAYSRLGTLSHKSILLEVTNKIGTQLSAVLILGSK